ncbi:MAG: response regulator [Archangiaceae bacterium]|nr:response regulator [Archangiaceae bacterium]
MSRRVLLVEDDEEIRGVVGDFIASEGYDVHAVPNGQLALDYLQKAEHLPALIMLDLMMPDMDGVRFRELQRADPRLAQVPVLVMSASSDVPAKANALGAAGHLKKPFQDLETLLAAIARFF